MWAHNWLDGIDRTRSAAAYAATSASAYATYAATHAETYAAYTANFAADAACGAIDATKAIKYTTYAANFIFNRRSASATACTVPIAAIAADPTIDLITIAKQARS
jgi:hypothetical protein